MRVTSGVIFIVCTLIDDSYKPISVKNLDSYCKKVIFRSKDRGTMLTIKRTTPVSCRLGLENQSTVHPTEEVTIRVSDVMATVK